MFLSASLQATNRSSIGLHRHHLRRTGKEKARFFKVEKSGGNGNYSIRNGNYSIEIGDYSIEIRLDLYVNLHKSNNQRCLWELQKRRDLPILEFPRVEIVENIVSTRFPHDIEGWCMPFVRT